jgi:hypothetical protein
MRKAAKLSALLARRVILTITLDHQCVRHARLDYFPSILDQVYAVFALRGHLMPYPDRLVVCFVRLDRFLRPTVSLIAVYVLRVLSHLISAL